MTKLRENIGNILAGLVLSIVFSTICNIIGYDIGLVESIPGLLILAGFSLAGFTLSYLVPLKKITAVLWISFVSILFASPISPVAEQVIFHVGNVSILALCTPILAYAGVLVGKDWGAFKELGIKAVIISIVVMAGTFLVSSMLGDFFMKIFN
ncbi:MAG: hypothetical protein RIN55_09175 [Tissierellaceae bacterium]|nr:hypothetical protein [Tissierellaceae bacterium]